MCNHIYTGISRKCCTVKILVLKRVINWDISDPDQTRVSRSYSYSGHIMCLLPDQLGRDDWRNKPIQDGVEAKAPLWLNRVGPAKWDWLTNGQGWTTERLSPLISLPRIQECDAVPSYRDAQEHYAPNKQKTCKFLLENSPFLYFFRRTENQFWRNSACDKGIQVAVVSKLQKRNISPAFEWVNFDYWWI